MPVLAGRDRKRGRVSERDQLRRDLRKHPSDLEKEPMLARLFFDFPDDCFGKLSRVGAAAEVARKDLAAHEDALQS